MPTGANTLTEARFAGGEQFAGTQNFDAAGAGKKIARKVNPDASIPMSEMGIVGKTVDKASSVLGAIGMIPLLAMPEVVLKMVGGWKYTPFKGAFNWAADKVKPIGKPARFMEHTSILGEKIPEATTKIVNGVEQVIPANFVSQKAEKIAATVGAKIENSGAVKAFLGSARQKSVAGVAKNLTSAAGHANLSTVAINGTIAAGHVVTAIGNYHDAKNLVNGLKAMVQDATGKKTSLFGLLVRGDAVDLGVSRTRVLLNLIVPTLGQGAVGAMDIHIMRSSAQAGLKNIMISAAMQMGVGMVTSMINGAIRPAQVDDYLQLRNAQSRGEQLPAEVYADFIRQVAPQMESVDRDGVKVNALAMKYAKEQTPLSQVLKEVTNKDIFQKKGYQAVQWVKQMQAASAPQSELTETQERLNGKQENLGQHTGAVLASKTGREKAASARAPSGDVMGSATANLAADRAMAALQTGAVTV